MMIVSTDSEKYNTLTFDISLWLPNFFFMFYVVLVSHLKEIGEAYLIQHTVQHISYRLWYVKSTKQRSLVWGKKHKLN